MATHSSILAWEIPWTEDSGQLQSWGCKRVEDNLVTKQQQQSLTALLTKISRAVRLFCKIIQEKYNMVDHSFQRKIENILVTMGYIKKVGQHIMNVLSV